MIDPAKFKVSKRDTLKICYGLLCTTMLLKINTIECTSSESSSTTPAPSTDAEYFTSITRMKELVRFEQSVIAEMKKVVEKFDTTESEPSSSENLWQEGLSKIKFYLRDYDSSVKPMLTDTADVQTTVVSHPLMMYRTMRRVVYYLPEILENDIDARLEKLKNVAALIQPAVTVADVVGAMEGILRLQKTYLISPYDFAQGRLRSFETKSGLTATDCFHIGKLALSEHRELSTAIEWLVQALRMSLQIEGSSGLNIIEMVRHGLRNAIEVHNDEVKNQNQWTFGKTIQTNLSEMTRDNENELIKTLPPHPSPPSYQLFHTAKKNNDINFNGLCRGDKLRNETLTKNLKCYLKTDNPFLAIKPLKVEVHSQDPLIMQFYDFMPDLVIKHFINMTSHRLQRAFVYAHTGDDRILSKRRIACNAWIDDKSDEILSRIPKIIHESTGLNLIPLNSSEHAQVASYGALGGYYGHHFDTLYEDRQSYFETLDFATRTRGDRIATIMFYLSDVKLGGGTAFPKIGVYAEPIKGSAIFWYNLKKNGELHDHTLHGGCPVLLGEKWVINKWIRSGDQMFIRKCSLDSNI